MSWLEEHIETFVAPRLNNYDREEGCNFGSKHSWNIGVETFNNSHSYFTDAELTVIKNTWRSIKQAAKQNGKKQILLPGRDVFIFEILARRENYPTVFIPECSRMSVTEIAKDFAKMRHCFLFDTGFAGSIPKALNMKNFKLLSHHLNNSVDRQIFPRLTMSRSLALKIEGTPKYWESGRVDVDESGNTRVWQPFSNIQEFIQAAQLTVAIYTNSAPKFIHRHRPLVPERKPIGGYPTWQTTTHW